MNSSQIVPEFPRNFVYFEKQSNDRLCGVHCLNSLVQAPMFDPISLAEIANKLDELEKKLYEDDINSMNFKNENVDDDGNYNVQVLSEALKLHGAEIVPVKQSECEQLLIDSMDSVEAFIFNSSTHWFSIRKICNIWFNLNSTNTGPGPQIISDFYLSAFIKGTEELGYTNFLVKSVPELPPLDSEYYKNLHPYQKLVTLEDIVKYKPKKINMGDTDDQALERALELSKKEYEKNNFPNNEYSDENLIYPKEEFQIKDFEQKLIEQDELKEVMEISMNEYVNELEKSLPQEPNTDSEHVNIEIKSYYKNINQKLSRTFKFEDKIGDIKNYIRAKLRTYGEVRLMGAVSNKIYLNDGQTLKEAGMLTKEVLSANILE